MSAGDVVIQETKDQNEEDMSADEEDGEEYEDEDEDESEQASESEPESESATEEEENDPSALVDGLMRIIFRKYAGKGRVGIERSEIVSMLKSEVKSKNDTLVNSMKFDININEAIRGACHAPVYALYETKSYDNFNAFKGMVREVDLLKVLPKKTRDERFKAQLIKDVHYIALADYLELFVECEYEDEELENDKSMDEYVLKNAPKFAVVGLPRSNYDTFDNGDFPQFDQQSIIIRVIN